MDDLKKYYTPLNLAMLKILEENLKKFKKEKASGSSDYLTLKAIVAFPKVITMIHNLAEARKQDAEDEKNQIIVVNEFLKEEVTCTNCGNAFEMLDIVGEAKHPESGFTCDLYTCRVCNHNFGFDIPNNFHEFVLFLESSYLQNKKLFEKIRKDGSDKKEKEHELVFKEFADYIAAHKKVEARIANRKADIIESEKQIEMLFNALTGGMDISHLN